MRRLAQCDTAGRPVLSNAFRQRFNAPAKLAWGRVALPDSQLIVKASEYNSNAFQEYSEYSEYPAFGLGSRLVLYP